MQACFRSRAPQVCNARKGRSESLRCICWCTAVQITWGALHSALCQRVAASRANPSLCFPALPAGPQIVCDGMYSAFRKKMARTDVKHPSFFIGLLLKVRCGAGALCCAAPTHGMPCSLRGLAPSCSTAGCHTMGSATCTAQQLSHVLCVHPCHTPQDCPLPHEGYGHVILGKPSPFLFYPISKTEVREPSSRTCSRPAAPCLQRAAHLRHSAHPVGPGPL